MSSGLLLKETDIAQQIYFIRGFRILIDSDLAKIYGVTTSRLNEQIKRNLKKFPPEFMFQPTPKEFRNLISQNATSSWGGRRKLPYAFTEHGVVMAATILNSDVAIRVSIRVVKVFVSITHLVAKHIELAEKINKLERSLKGRLNKHDIDIRILLEAIHQLMQPPNPPRKKIGFKQ